MKIEFPSREFDDAVAAVCHDAASDEQVRALNELLRSDAAARDEYILWLELHSRLASQPDLFALTNENKAAPGAITLPPQARPRATARKLTWAVALAACVGRKRHHPAARIATQAAHATAQVSLRAVARGRA
jgi:hypothetical protein